MIEQNSIIRGDAQSVLTALPEGSVDAIITDPPYGVRYKDRSGRSIQGDDDLTEVLAAVPEMYRVLKDDAVCISFYGWNQIDEFMIAWRSAGFRPVGHIVWKKDYTSKRGMLDACHEQAYVLAKGRPQRPDQAILDVQDWVYSGNRSHPTEKSIENLKPLIEAFTKPGDLVCDPFSGSGSTSVAAAFLGRRYLGIELEQEFCDIARKRLAGVAEFQQMAA